MGAGDVLEYDFSNGKRARPPANVEARLSSWQARAQGAHASEAKDAQRPRDTPAKATPEARPKPVARPRALALDDEVPRHAPSGRAPTDDFTAMARRALDDGVGSSAPSRSAGIASRRGSGAGAGAARTLEDVEPRSPRARRGSMSGASGAASSSPRGSLTSASPVGASVRYRLSQRVEVRRRGGSRWLPGRVVGENAGGTFDVRYDDGEEERRVPPEQMRPATSTAAAATPEAKSSSRAGDGDVVARSFAVGDKVEANYKGKGRWFKGSISAKNRDGTFDVRYDDGDEERNVEKQNIRLQEESARRKDDVLGGDGRGVDTSVGGSFVEGDRIEANYKGKGRWFKGKVLSKNRDGTFDVRYDDGDSEDRVEKTRIRRLSGDGGPGTGSAAAAGRRILSDGAQAKESSRDGSSAVHKVGAVVEARYKGGMRWLPGVVRCVNGDGTYDVRYDDGDVEAGIDAPLVRPKGGGHSSSIAGGGSGHRAAGSGGSSDLEDGRKSRLATAVDGEADLLLEGDPVEANYKGKGRWFKGKVTRLNRDGTFDVRYDDGDTEDRVEPRNIRPLAGSGGSGRAKETSKGGGSGAIMTGDAVEANYKGKGRWFKGSVKAANRDGTFHIRYDDGDEEKAVDPKDCRRVGAATPAASERSPGRRVLSKGDSEESLPAHRFSIGDAIEARYKGRTKWLPGTVRRANRDGTYDVRYENGDEEAGVTAALMRVAAAASTAGSGDVAVGDRIEANYKGKGRWFKGLVTLKHRDGTIDVRYDDGDEERNVEARNVRTVDAVGSSRGKDGASGGGGPKDSDSRAVAVGDAIEANYKGKGRWFKGKILSKNRDGTFDVLYDDGDEERSVEALNVRLLGSVGRGGTGAASDVISRKVRSAAADSDVEQSKLAEGDRVEANYKGKGKWFKGKITLKHRDGTFDVRYDDGDEERNIEQRNVRTLEESSARGGKDDAAAASSGGAGGGRTGSSLLLEGDRIEANYKGKGRWFKGKVVSKNRNGTFDVRYDDGDEERDVEPSMVRALDAAGSRPAAANRRTNSFDTPAASDVDGGPSRPGPRDSSKAPPPREGDSVEARFRGGSWTAATVRRVNSDRTMDVRFDTGEMERNLEPSAVRALPAKTPSRPAVRRRSADSDAETPAGGVRSRSGGGGGDLLEGDRVEANYKGKGRWFKGKILAKNRDGAFHVQYDDGDEERLVEAANIRRFGGAASAAAVSSPAAARGGAVRSGSLSDDERRRGSDGEKRREVADGAARRDNSAGDDFEVGAAAEARRRGGDRWVSCRIVAKHRDATYDVRYTDGDEETRVSSRLLRKRASSPSRGGVEVVSEAEAPPPLRPGDSCEARYRGRAEWVRGRVTAVHRDGTYDIRYIDGADEERVAPRMARPARAGAGGGGAVSEVEAPPPLRVGDACEARYRGEERWSLGSVTATHRDCSYDVRYADGAVEDHVPARRVRAVSAAAAAAAKAKGAALDKFAVSDAVEARRGGSAGRWEAARVIAVHRDATLDVRYDGDRREERRLEPRFVRQRVGAANGADTAASEAENAGKMAAGDRCEARYKGGSEWRRGVVVQAHRDGSCDVNYDSGGEERRVEARYVRKAAAASPKRDGRGVSPSRQLSGDASDGGKSPPKGGSSPPPPPEARAVARRVKEALVRGRRKAKDVAAYMEHYAERSGGSGSATLISEANFAKVLHKFRVEMSREEERAMFRWCRPPEAVRDMVRFKPFLRLLESENGSSDDDDDSGSDGHQGRRRRRRTPRGSSADSSSLSNAGGSGSGSEGARRKAARHRRKRSPAALLSPFRGKKAASQAADSDVSKEASDSGSGDSDGAAGGKKTKGALVPHRALKQLVALMQSGAGAVRKAFEAAAASGGSGRAGSDDDGDNAGAELSEKQFARFLRKANVKASPDEAAALWKWSLKSEGEDAVSTAGIFELILAGCRDSDAASAALDKFAEALAKKGSKAAAADLRKALRGAASKGMVKEKDFRKVLEQMGVKMASKDLKEIVKRLDPTAGGAIDAAAAAAWLCGAVDASGAAERMGRQMEALAAGGRDVKTVFKGYDPARTGEVDLRALRSACAEAGLLLSRGHIAALARRHISPDGGIAYRKILKAASEAAAGAGSPSDGSGTDKKPKDGKKRRSEGEKGSGNDIDEATAASEDSSQDGAVDETKRLVPTGTADWLAGLVGRKGSGGGKSKGGGGASVREAFDAVCDGDSTATFKQLRKVLKKLGMEAPAEEVDALAAVAGALRGTSSVAYFDFLELLHCKREMKEVAQLHKRLAKHLAKRNASTAAKLGLGKGKAKGPAVDVALALFARNGSEAEKSGSGGGAAAISSADFSRALDKLCSPPLNAKEKAMLAARFDPRETGKVDRDAFCAWLAAGADPAQSQAKVRRWLALLEKRDVDAKAELLKLCTGGKSGSNNSSGKKSDSESKKKDSKRKLSAAALRMGLSVRLGLPLAEGDWAALWAALEGPDKSDITLGDFWDACGPGSKQGGKGEKGKSKDAEKGSGDDANGDSGSGDEDNDEKEAPEGRVAALMRFAREKTGGKAEKGENSGKKSPSRSKKDNHEDGSSAEDSEADDGDDGRGSGGERSSKSDKRNATKKAEAAARATALRQLGATIRGEAESAADRDGNGEVDWIGSCEALDPDLTGLITLTDLQSALKECGVSKLSDDDLALLLGRFGVASKDAGGSKLIGYPALARWLETGAGVDDRLLKRVQKHLKVRASRGFDQRSMFNEMARGKHHIGAKDLARGLRKAGLKVSSETAGELVAAFARNGRSHLDFGDFHRLCTVRGVSNLNDPSSPMAATRFGASGTLGGPDSDGGGYGSGTLNATAARVDDEVFHSMLKALEKAFSFYDADNSNSIDASELQVILRAMGHDPTRKELKAMMRKADIDKNGVLQFEEFQAAVMPFLTSKTRCKQMSAAELRAVFDLVDADGSGSISPAEFRFMFCKKLQVLTDNEASALVSVLDRDGDGVVSWDEFMALFDMVDDPSAAGANMLPANVRAVVAAALRKLKLGARADPEEQLVAFMGMPSTYRRSVLAPLDRLKQYSLQHLLLPQLDGRGSVHLLDMEVRVTTTVTTIEGVPVVAPNGAGRDPKAQLVVSQNVDLKRGDTINSRDSPSMLSSFLARMRSPSASPASSPSKKNLSLTLDSGEGYGGYGGYNSNGRTSTTTDRRRSHLLGEAVSTTATTVMRKAALTPVGAATRDRAAKEARAEMGGTANGVAPPSGPGKVWQVVLSAKMAAGIPVPADVRAKDVLQRSMRACLFCEPAKEVDVDAGAPAPEIEDYFVGNAFQTLAKQHPHKEEVWLFPDAAHDGDRKFLVRTDFWDDRDVHCRDRLFVLLELTCTIRTPRPSAGEGDTGVRGPLKNFSAKHQSAARGSDSEDSGRRGGRGGRRGASSDSEASSGGGKEPRKRRGNSQSDEEGSEGGGKAAGKRGRSRGGRAERGDKSNKSPKKRRRQGAGSEGRNNRGSGSEGGSDSGDSDSEDAATPARGKAGAKQRQQQQQRQRQRGTGHKKGRRGGGGGSSSGSGGDSSGDEMLGGDEDLVETEMSCGWVQIPLKDLVATSEARHVKYHLQGGTPFAKADIDKNEVMTRRYGWRAMLKAVRLDGVDKSSELEVKILPVHGLSKQAQEDVCRLPRNIVVAEASASLIRCYREYAANELTRHGDRSHGSAGFGVSGAFSDPVLTLFPKVAADPAMMGALRDLWEREHHRRLPKSLAAVATGAAAATSAASSAVTSAAAAVTGGAAAAAAAAAERASKELEARVAAFRHAVLRLWPAHSHLAVQKLAITQFESFERREQRATKVRQIVSASDSFRSDTPTGASKAGRAAAATAEEAVYVAFSNREVAFDVA